MVGKVPHPDLSGADPLGARRKERNILTKQMCITYHSAVVFVRDIEVSKQFYTNVLELAIELDFGKNVLLKGGITL